jgi:hypothetical protein
MEEDMHKLGVVEDHMSPWSVVGKKKCWYWFVLRLQKRRKGHWSTINLTTMIEAPKA